MSVLDRAIVKAFERRSQSATTEKQTFVEVQPPAPSAPVEAPEPTVPAVKSSISKSASPVLVPVDQHGQAESSQSPESDTSHPHQPETQIASSQPEPVVQSPSIPMERQSRRSTDRRDVPETQLTEPATFRTESQDTASAKDTTVAIPSVPVPIPEPSVQSAQPEIEVSPKAVVAPQLTVPSISPPGPQTWKWPAICEQLDQFTGEGFQQLAKHLQFAAEQGHKVLAFVSSQRDAGRTSVLLTLTRILALEGKSSVLLIDADHRHPNIAALTGLQPQTGFDDVLQGTARVQQATNSMTPGRVAVLPLLKPASEVDWQKTVTPFRTLLHQARREYDMILVDAGVFPVETKLTECWLRGIADAVVTVSRQLTGPSSEHVVLDWKKIGIESLGVIETFA
ncbi:MAG: CobQ/CobB/MinD/ParA nucleotide binding protein [Planctomycetaceae bacterium]|nr:CobQ/CobB/MinD/ParA nucleotide binding protein [Planctomycetaceae bacterium]